MYLIWGAIRRGVALFAKSGEIESSEFYSFEQLIEFLKARRHTPGDTVVICENRSQVTLRILKAIPVDLVPKAIFVVTPDPGNKWLTERIPDHLREITRLTTDPTNVQRGL